jgi:hypothetical protein
MVSREKQERILLLIDLRDRLLDADRLFGFARVEQSNPFHDQNAGQQIIFSAVATDSFSLYGKIERSFKSTLKDSQ